MPKISILMSVYNESRREIEESINSILNQDFTDFEFIIVNDNPDRECLNDILNNFDLDNRIKIIKNKKNIGLAMSLNKAANESRSQILARMDADDISEKSRLRLEYNIIKEGGYGLVCTNYSFINENSEFIDGYVTNYSSEQIKSILPLGNVIHHPTVMMKKSLFFKVGGYRNFSSAQDYDLWLRFLEKNCIFYMIKEKLLRYRIRKDSISVSKRIQQQCTLIYIRKLYIQRLKMGKDNYSYEDYISYLKKNNVMNDREKKKMNKYYKSLVRSHEYYREKKYIKALYLRINVFLVSKIYRKSFISKLKTKVYLKKLNEN